MTFRDKLKEELLEAKIELDDIGDDKPFIEMMKDAGVTFMIKSKDLIVFDNKEIKTVEKLLKDNGNSPKAITEGKENKAITNSGDFIRTYADKKNIDVVVAIVNGSSIEITGDKKDLEDLNSWINDNVIDSKMYSKVAKDRIVVGMNESEEINEGMAPFTDDQLKQLDKEYSKIDTINPGSPSEQKLRKFLSKLPVDNLKQLKGAKIKWLSLMASTELRHQGINESQVNEAQAPITVIIYRNGKLVAEQPLKSSSALREFTDKYFENISKPNNMGVQTAKEKSTGSDIELIVIQDVPLYESQVNEGDDISKAVEGLLGGARKAFEYAILMYAPDVEDGKMTGNDAINKAMVRVADEFKKYGVSKKDAELLVKVAGAQSLKDNGLDLPEKFLKQLKQELGA